MSNTILSILNQSINNANVSALLEELRDKDSKFLLYNPEKQDVKGPLDKWECHAAESMGVTIEILDDVVISICIESSFTKVLEFLFIEEEFQTLISTMSRAAVQNRLGKPLYCTGLFDHYLMNDEVVLGVLSWPHLNDEVSTYCFGSKRIFSDPERIPNRSSFTFDSLYHQFN